MNSIFMQIAGLAPQFVLGIGICITILVNVICVVDANQWVSRHVVPE